MGLFTKKDPCAICGEKVKGLLPWKVEGQYVCNDCYGVVDIQGDANKMTMQEFLQYRAFREENQKLAEQFTISEKVDFGAFDTKIIFDFDKQLFCMSKRPDKTIFHGSELKSFVIKEDSFPLIEGSASGLVRHESGVQDQVRTYMPMITQFQMEKEMRRQYYSMRLVAEATKSDFSTLPKELQNVEMETEDSALSYLSKMQKARNVVSDDDYERTKTEIMSAVTECLGELLTTTQNRQGRASMIFSDMYLKLEVGIGILVILLLWICVMLRRLIVKPLIRYNESIRRGEIFQVIGAVELQNLATTYNTVYLENQKIQKLIRYQAEHDALTQL